LDFSSTAIWASTILCSAAHARKGCRAFFPFVASWERLNVLPSMAMTPVIFSVTPRTQERQTLLKLFGIDARKHPTKRIV
jgi:hypothetical protein